MSKEHALKIFIQHHRDKLAEAESELAELQRGVKGTVVLLTGEKVPEYQASHQIITDTHCPGKWVTVNVESGQFYSWHPLRKTWISPPKKVAAAFKKFLKGLR